MVEILNSNIVKEYLPEWSVSDEKLAQAADSVLPKRVRTGKINIAFVDMSEIKRLNLEYRNIDNPTDVLSFAYEDKAMVGEVYICPEYISQGYSRRDFVVEILRCIVHGILHLAGEDHKGNFTGDRTEPMFEKQEEMLDSILKQLEI